MLLNSPMPRLVLAFILVGSCSCTAAESTLTPLCADQFFVAPGKPITLQWRVAGAAASSGFDYSIHDYSDTVVKSGRTTSNARQITALTVDLAQGYYEAVFSGLDQRFGLMVLPQRQGDLDPFFAIDSSLSWHAKDDGIRESLISIARRYGVGMVRERLHWGAMEPEAGKWTWDGRNRYEALRRLCEKNGVSVLDVTSHSPAWLGKVGLYPQDLVGACRSWRELTRRFQFAWGAVELWNEPDLPSYSGGLPADQYVALAKAMSYAVAAEREAQSRPLIVGGVMAFWDESFVETAAANDLLRFIDAFSFHSYVKAPDMVWQVGRSRDWLRKHGSEGLPLWITECGFPGKKGPRRSPISEDLLSAQNIAMKGVEARACGIARYFPFLYVFYEESTLNYGMMDKAFTPQRSIAAYFQLIRNVAGMTYLGDLSVSDKAITRARVFGGDECGDRAVVVLYAEKPNAAMRLELNLPIIRVEDIDGRVIPVGEDARAALPNGLSYVWVNRRSLDGRLNKTTKTMSLWKSARSRNPAPAAVAPIVMRLNFENSPLRPHPTGYYIDESAKGKFVLTVRVFNLSAEAQSLNFSLESSEIGLASGKPDASPGLAPANGYVDVSWNLKLNKKLEKSPAWARVVAKNASGRPVSTMAFCLSDRPYPKNRIP